MTRLSKNASIAILASLCLAPPAMADAATPSAAPAQIVPAGYILGPNDEIRVSVFGNYPIDVKTRIKENGTITLPHIGDVLAQGQTPTGFAERIRKQLIAAGQFVDPVVNVEVTNFVSRSVTVFGNLNSPGLYPLDRDQTVAMMLARAGGARADGADYIVLKRDGEADRTIRLNDLSPQSGTAQPMKPGDTLFVPKAEDIFMYGQVNKPGRYVFESGMTLRQMLALAGGPTLGGSEKKITLHRGKEKIKRADLDMEVKPGDVFTVKERIF
ncbi:MAG: polysaccharide biosynthesis/export family protein [Sphingobium sp.]